MREGPWGARLVKKIGEGFLLGLGAWLARPLVDLLIDWMANLVARAAGR